jgi:regulator of cell morphogenesis and NO signaling
MQTTARSLVTEDDVVELIDHIIGTHHVFTRSELPRLLTLARKVAASAPEDYTLSAVADLIAQLATDLVPHMDKEEQILFPYIIALELGVAIHPPFASVKQPIAVMRREHERTLILLRAIRTASHEFRLPIDAGADLRELYAGLLALEEDLTTHMSLEGDVLFARSIAGEATLASAR